MVKTKRLKHPLPLVSDNLSSTAQPVIFLETLCVLSEGARSSTTSISFIGLFFIKHTLKCSLLAICIF